MHIAAIILATCFLFFCRPAYHAPRSHEVPEVSRFCKGVNDAFAKSPDKNREKFIAVWPVAKQTEVRNCLGD